MSLPLAALRAVRVVVSHCYPDGACPDGLASAMIIKDVLPEASYRFVSHSTLEYEQITAEPGMLFVDITPPAARASEFRDAGALVLDHHKDKEDLVASFGERGVFAHEEREPGVSGALLAFRHVWLPVNQASRPYDGFVATFSRAGVAEGARARVERFARLAGVRDTWQTQDRLWKEACEQAAVLCFYSMEDWLQDTRQNFGDVNHRDVSRSLERRMEIGSHLIMKQEREVDALVKSAYSFVTGGGTRVTVLPSVRISDAANRFMEGCRGPSTLREADVVVGFAFYVEGGEPSMRLSFRSRSTSAKSVDVSAIARDLGGGGHTHAAGASLKLGENSAHPYELIRNLLMMKV